MKPSPNAQLPDAVEFYEVAPVATTTDAAPSLQDAEATKADDPLALFSWQIRYRATSTFSNGPYEARMVIGADSWIQSWDSFEGLMAVMREKAAQVVKKLES